VAAVVYMDPAPVRSFAFSVAWLVTVILVSLLMVSTWRYPSFKQINTSTPRTPLIVLVVGGLAFLIWEWSQPVLLAAACAYLLSGVVMKMAGLVRRLTKPKPRPSAPVTEHPVV
jgi:CDP-diacylglycerol--serine O-phosphatidyltransferase